MRFGCGAPAYDAVELGTHGEQKMEAIMSASTTERRKNWLGIHWAAWCVLGVALTLLLIEHFTHVLGVLPYLIILACPLMHFFMHGKHGHGHGGGHEHDGTHNPTRTDRN